MRTRIVVVNLDLFGHINPTLPVVAELTRRGADVTYFAGEEFREVVTGVGARLISEKGFERGRASNGLLFLTRLCLRTMRTLERHFGKLNPDLVLYDTSCLAARFVAKKMQIRAASFRPMYAFNEAFTIAALERKGAAFRRPSQRRYLAAPNRGTELTEFRASAKKLEQLVGESIRSIQDVFGFQEQLSICSVLREFQFDAGTFDRRTKFVGPCVAPRSRGSRLPRVVDRRPLIYVSMGTMLYSPEFVVRCIEALIGGPWRALLALPERSGLVGRTFGDNIEIAGFVPQLELLRSAKLFITHGGMNSVMEALTVGTPTLVIPQTVEEAATATRVEELGLGRALPPWTTAKEIRAVVEDLMCDYAVRRRLVTMKARVARAGGFKSAASTLLDYARA